MEKAATSEDPLCLFDVDDIPTVAESAAEDEEPPYLYDEDGTIIAARGTFESVTIQCRVRNYAGEVTWVDVHVAALPHPHEMVENYGGVERRIGDDSPIAWSGQSDRATVSRMARVQPCPGDTCDACEQVLTAVDIAESGDFEDCERLPRERWFEDMNPCPYNRWGPDPDGVTYVMFPDG